MFVRLPLTHRLRFVHIIAPHIDAMSPDQHSVRIRVLLHSFLHELGEILLVRRVLDDRNAQRVMVPEVSRLLETAPEPFDLLDVVDLKDLALFTVAAMLRLEEKRHEHGPLRVRVDLGGRRTLKKYSKDL